jgi:glyoxylase-like metal-dependent hydrolase (beta-lactamase superfamily II)
VLQTGGLYFSGAYPVIDYTTGGWIGGMADALDKLLKVGDAQTKIIPGHGPLSSKQDMQAVSDWKMELPSPNALTIDNVKRDFIKQGDRVAVNLWPAKNGSRLAHTLTLTLPDGRVMNFPRDWIPGRGPL